MGLLMLATLLAAAPEAQVQTLDGQTLAGHVTSLSDDTLVLATADGERTLGTKQLLGITLSPAAAGSVGSGAAGSPAVWVTLADQSLLVAKTYTVGDGEAHVTLVGGRTLDVPTRAIDSVRFREHTGPLIEQWSEIGKADRSGDLLVVRKDDALDFHSGVLRDVGSDVVQFDLDGDTLRVKRTKVDGLFYHATGRPQPPAALCSMNDAAGSQLRLATLALEGDNLRVRTTGGLEITWPLAELARIDFSQGNLQYLADLKPESTVWTPYFGNANDSPAAREFYRPRVDRSLEGGALRLGGKDYAKGLAVHSRTELSYRLPEKCRSFQALAGIDDRLRPAGNVRLLILGDERTLFDEILTGKDAPRPLELDISGVNRLKFVVDFGDDMDVGDALDLCEARILK